MCGRPIERRRAKIVFVEGARLLLCPTCCSKVVRTMTNVEVKDYESNVKRSRAKTTMSTKRSTQRIEEYEVVPDFAERVRKAREKLGWTQRMLAEAVKERESVIKRIEGGRLVPSIDLARRLERVLGIKLLEPVPESSTTSFMTSTSLSKMKELTLGDIVVIRKKKEGKE